MHNIPGGDGRGGGDDKLNIYFNRKNGVWLNMELESQARPRQDGNMEKIQVW